MRGDGALFLSVTLVDSEAWIGMALNSFISYAKLNNVSGLTIMTMNDERLGSVFRRLGLFTYDAKATIATFPEDFRLEKPLPSWSWGAIIFLRFNAWFEAFLFYRVLFYRHGRDIQQRSIFRRRSQQRVC